MERLRIQSGGRVPRTRILRQVRLTWHARNHEALRPVQDQPELLRLPMAQAGTGQALDKEEELPDKAVERTTPCFGC